MRCMIGKSGLRAVAGILAAVLIAGCAGKGSPSGSARPPTTQPTVQTTGSTGTTADDAGECLRLIKLGTPIHAALTKLAPQRASAWIEGEKQGDPAASWLIALCQVSGSGLPKNQPAAAQRARVAAAKNYAPAMVTVGQFYANGLGV